MEPNYNNFSDNFKLETGIGPTVDRILNSLLDRITSDAFREKLAHRIVDPMTGIINQKIRPYIYTFIVLYAVIVLLLLIIIYLIVAKKNIQMT